MNNVRKVISVILGLALLIGAVSTSAFAATTGSGTESDPIVCKTINDIVGTYTLQPDSQLWFEAPVGGEILSVTDPNGDAQFMDPNTWFNRGMQMDYTNLPAGDINYVCIVNTNASSSVTVNLILGALDSGEEEGDDINLGTQEFPLVVEYTSTFLAYLMNESLEAGDTDGIWYKLTAVKGGVVFVDVNCYDEVDYGCDVYTESYQGVASEGNPIITYRIQKGETILIHKYVKPDSKGNIAAASKFYVSANVVTADETDTVSIKTSGIKIPVAGGDSISVLDQSRQAVFSGMGLLVSGDRDAIRYTTVTIGSNVYKDVDGDGVIELTVPGNATSRSVITITNNYKSNTAYTFTAVETAEEGPAVSVPGDMNEDLIVNNDDVVLLLWHSLFPVEYPLTANCDLTGDGTVNNDDVVLLLWHSLFPQEYPLS